MHALKLENCRVDYAPGSTGAAHAPIRINLIHKPCVALSFCQEEKSSKGGGLNFSIDHECIYATAREREKQATKKERWFFYKKNFSADACIQCHRHLVIMLWIKHIVFIHISLAFIYVLYIT